MLVNVITRYSRPLPEFLFGPAVDNAQQFGSPRIHSPPRQLWPGTIANASVLGSPAIAAVIHVTHDVVPSGITNPNQFGSPAIGRPPKVIASAVVVNVSQFAVTSIGVATKRFSYANALGTGDRTSDITVTTSGGNTFDSPMRLVDGNLTANNFWGYGPITITFDIGARKIIRQARWIQDTWTTHNGLFRWKGSNDGAGYDDIGGTFYLGGSPVSLCNTLLDNATAYRWYRLAPTAGASLSGAPYFREVEFYIEGGIGDPPG